jgi:hypothetical protein
MAEMGANQSGDRQRFERELLEHIRLARNEYRTALVAASALTVKHRDLDLGHPDGAVARRQAARLETEALHHYRCALKNYMDFVVRGVPPPVSAEQQDQ